MAYRPNRVTCCVCKVSVYSDMYDAHIHMKHSQDAIPIWLKVIGVVFTAIVALRISNEPDRLTDFVNSIIPTSLQLFDYLVPPPSIKASDPLALTVEQKYYQDLLYLYVDEISAEFDRTYFEKWEQHLGTSSVKNVFSLILSDISLNIAASDNASSFIQGYLEVFCQIQCAGNYFMQLKKDPLLDLTTQIEKLVQDHQAIIPAPCSNTIVLNRAKFKKLSEELRNIYEAKKGKKIEDNSMRQLKQVVTTLKVAVMMNPSEDLLEKVTDKLCEKMKDLKHGKFQKHLLKVIDEVYEKDQTD